MDAWVDDMRIPGERRPRSFGTRPLESDWKTGRRQRVIPTLPA
jgi:hypothetical protein